MNNFNIIKNEDFQMGEFGNLTVFIDEENEPWFYGNEIAEKLGYDRPDKAVQKFVNQIDMKIISRKSLISNACPDLGQALSINKLWKNENDFMDKILINEPALYELTFRSKMSNARAFTNKVTHEILPTIRKTGAYMTKETLAELEKNPRKMAELYNKLADLQEENERKEKKNKALLEANKKNTAIIRLVDAAIAKGDSLDIETFAKLINKPGYYNKGRNNTYGLLRENKWINAKNKPYQSIIDKGLLTTKYDSFLITKNGHERLIEHIKVFITVKGMKEFSRILAKDLIVSEPLF